MTRRRFDRHDTVALIAVLGGGLVVAGEWLLVSHDTDSYTSIGLATPAAYTTATAPQVVVLALLALTVRCLFTDTDTGLKLSSALTGAAATATAVLPKLLSYHHWTGSLIGPLMWTLATLAVHALAAVLMFLIAWLLDAETLNANP